MTRSVENPRIDTELSSVKGRVTDLERKLDDAFAARRPDTVFTLAGILFVSESTPYPLPVRRNYIEVAVALGTPTTAGTLTIECRLEGTPVHIIEVAVGLARLFVPVEIEAPKNTVITTAVTDPGTGGRDLTVAWRT